ncbi:MAG: methenyltetrahydromethanopterin cyclohydrolase [Fuerstiella sp.]|nr:methenyltetrahydromethanopterin cyclohydrolase [Fuerstiella sp.]MCP4853845.1 methenyltetrahydromethanopterin cyclohydrolase [Fuerstiella sp.]
MAEPLPLNNRAHGLYRTAVADQDVLRLAHVQQSRAEILDFGVNVAGGLAAGLHLAEMCMSGLGKVRLQAAGPTIDLPQVFVSTDHPLQACLLSQYAGWKIATDDFFAMGSGPMRATAAGEALFKEFRVTEDKTSCVGVLEAGSLPTQSAIDQMLGQVGNVDQLSIAVAPTASQAGNIQVVARSVETAMHKLHELGFPVATVISGTGLAPLPPVAKNDLAGIGRTNDAILYGSTVNLWVDCDDEQIQSVGADTPSCSSDSHGRLFLELFKEANHDFYALDKALFSPGIVVFHNLRSGNTFQYGKLMPDLLRTSFGMHNTHDGT